MQRTQFCVYVFVAALNTGCLLVQIGAMPDVNCKSTEIAFRGSAYDVEIPPEGDFVKGICGEGHCCTQLMENKISYHTGRDFGANHTKHVVKKMSDLSSWLQQKADRFDNVFKEMLNSSKAGFHAMFTKTYGIIYEQNAYVFTDLFKELEKYYSKGNVDLTATLDDFFNILYQKMFTVLNAGYKFTEKYLECVNERMKELKPFGDVPSKLTTLLKRSFLATRTFSRGLHAGATIVRNMQNATVTDKCHGLIAKLFHCSACSGHSALLPCPDQCIRVMKTCYSDHMLLEQHWNSFIDASDKVIERLLGPFNIEMVVIPIDIKISEAIMNFQENAQQVTRRVFGDCGKPPLERSKREEGEIELESLDFSNRDMGGMDNGGGGKGEEPGKLERVIRETRVVLKDSKGFWDHLPSLMCKSHKDHYCWNSTAKAINPNMDEKSLSDVPSLHGGVRVPSSLVMEQIYALRTITIHLRNAYNGLDMEWIDSEGMDSGSGSGSGSGIDLSESGSGDDSLTEIPEEPPYTVSVSPPTRGEEGTKGTSSHPTGDDDNKQPNEIPPIPDLSRSVNSNKTQTASGSSSRIAFSFVVPIILVSFGNTVIDLVI